VARPSIQKLVAVQQSILNLKLPAQ
jgi:hypothetical protein